MAERTIQCITCGVQFVHAGGKGRPPVHCSAACGRRKMSPNRRERPAPCEGCGQVGVLFSGLCDPCRSRQARIKRQWYRRHSRGRAYLPPALTDPMTVEQIKAASPKHNDHECQVCGTSFRPKETNRTTVCSRECGFVLAKVLAGLPFDAPPQRARQRARRRALKHMVPYEPVNPTAVFDRDGWRCKICGIETPKEKRGTTDPQAPELDHVVPISKGGPHTYSNTQCACRACNGAKGAKMPSDIAA